MMTDSGDNRLKNSRVGSQRWTRIREAYQSGEFGKQNPVLRSGSRRIPRRNALADISTVSTNANASCQKHQYHQLAERVRELQQEIAPDLLYQIIPTYSPFSSMTPSSTGSSGSLPTYSHQQSISVSSGSSTSSVPTQRFGLSPRMAERAHQIPERFWIDWQQKQMQDRIEELEYIKSNIGCHPSSSFLATEMDENGPDFSAVDPRISNDEARRRSVIYLHEAQRLANQRRTSLAQIAAFKETIIPKNTEEISELIDHDDDSSFSFDQRSEDTPDDEPNLQDLEEIPSEPLLPIPSIQPSQSTLDRSRLTISLPFTYTNTQEHIIFPHRYRQISIQPSLDKVIEPNDDVMQTTSPTNSIEDVAQIDTEFNLTLIKREEPKKTKPLFYTKVTVNRSVEFHPFRPISLRNSAKPLKKQIIIPIPIVKRKEITATRSSSPTVSFRSARSRLSSIADSDNLDDDIQFLSVRRPSSSLANSSRSQFTSSPIISTITQSCHHQNSYPLLTQISSDHCTCFPQDSSMINDSDLEQSIYRSSSSSRCSTTSSAGEDHLSCSPPLFTCRHRQRRRKRKSNSSLLSSPSSSQHSLPVLHDSFRQTKENNNNNKRTLKTTHNTSIISSKRTWQWKQTDGNFRRDVLVNDNNVTRSSSLLTSATAAAAAVADCLIQRQRRKQTRLKRKAESEKRKEKREKRKKERNKKSPLSTTRAEATEASLFQFSTDDRPTIDTSVIFYPHEQLRCAERSTAKERICFPIQTSGEHQKQKSKLNITMADGHANNTSNPIPKRKENVRVFVRRRRRTTKHRKRTYLYSSSSSSNNSHETIPSTPNNIEQLVTSIQEQINNKQERSRKNRNIIVVNYKPVFINSRPQKSSSTIKTSPTSIPKQTVVPTDDDFSSATHYSRRRSLTTTSSDGSPLRSTTNRAHNQQSVSLDVPDVEDPLMFIEMMYQQLFTEDGRLRSGTESAALANCVKQIVRNSRRNSISSSIANGSASSHSKHPNPSANHQSQKFSTSSHHHLTPSMPLSLSSSPYLIPNEQYNTTSEEDEEEEEEGEEEPNTLVQINSQRPTILAHTDISKNSKSVEIDNHSQIHAFLNSYQPKQFTVNRTITTSNGFRFSIDDTDNEDFDTFSDLNSIRFNNKTIGTSPSVEEDLTHTDSRLLSSSGYQSLEPSSKSFKSLLTKSHSENDLFYSLYKTTTSTRCIHYCPNCIPPPTITVIPPMTSTLSSSSSSNIIQRLQQPIGDMFMKYLNFILISKNVLLLPLFIFLLRQRSIHIGN